MECTRTRVLEYNAIVESNYKIPWIKHKVFHYVHILDKTHCKHLVENTAFCLCHICVQTQHQMSY